MLKLLIMAIVACSAISSASASPLTIKNETLEVTYDEAAGALNVRSIAQNKAFITAGKLVDVTGSARIVKTNDPAFGKGQGIEISSAAGKCEISLYPKLPFALIRRTITNTTGDLMQISRADTLKTELSLGKPASELVLVGTGGRKKATESAGSFEWVAVAEPFTRHGVVAGWITHDKSCGVLFSEADGDKVKLSARSDFGTLNIKPGASARLETLAVGYFDDVRLGLEGWADAVAKAYKIKLPALPVGYCTWYHAGASNENDIVRDAAIAAEKLKPYGFSFVQIDDGWQDGNSNNGPHKNFTRVRPDGPYPGGMKPVAEAITRLGLTPGIWFMPFSGNHDDPWWADKQQFFFKTKDGKPYSAHWSGTLIDVTNPDAEKYLREEIIRIKDWGYTYFKMDGLHSGNGSKQTYPNLWYAEDNFGEALVSNPEKTNIEAYRDGLRLIRDIAGKEVFILGCCAPQNMRSYGGTFGLVDAMRIGPDNGGSWGGWMVSPRSTSVHYFLNGRIWHNDPDPVYVRESIPMDQARTMCSWQAITGSLTALSDSFASLSDERIDLVRRIMPTHKATARPVDMLESDFSRVWLVTDTKNGVRRNVIGLFNWSDQPSSFKYDMAYIGLDPKAKYAAYDFWTGQFFNIQGKLDLEIPAASCRVLAVRPVSDRPFLLSTNRHVTQGIVDVLEEKWNPAENALTGRSLVVGNDPYELRIVTGSSVAGLSVSAADRAKGVKIAHDKSENGLARVTITSPVNREVSWKVTFSE